MATAPTLPPEPVETYLSSAWEPDREYVDGALVDRHSGERKHSRLQALLIQLLMTQEAEHNILVYPEQRIYVRSQRYRVPDVVVMPADHKVEDVFTEPPLLVIEVVSRDDEWGAILDKSEDYFRLGVPNIVFADPNRQRVFQVDGRGLLSECEALTANINFPGARHLTVDFASLFSRL